MKAKKRYGQNFLNDKNILNKIIKAAADAQGNNILEIGTGHGALTKELDKIGLPVISYEIDKDLWEYNDSEMLPTLKNTTLLKGDFLKSEIPSLDKDSQYKVIANIPYYITSPIIDKLIQHKSLVNSIYIMMQKEVAMRIVSKEGTKDYGSFGIYVQYYCHVKRLFDISRNCFTPPPKVTSSFVELIPRKKPLVEVKDETLFFDIVHAAFWGRRKTITSAIKKFQKTQYVGPKIEAVLEKLEINPMIRGEKLSIQQFANIANELSS